MYGLLEISQEVLENFRYDVARLLELFSVLVLKFQILIRITWIIKKNITKHIVAF
jgi:hypothetical protein